jgi:hypothetical protein
MRKDGKYYARAPKRTFPGAGNCLGVRSPVLKLE